MQTYKIKHYNQGALRNFISSLLVTLSPHVPKNQRKTLKKIRSEEKQRRRDAQILKAITK